MAIEKSNEFGSINISNEAIAMLAGGVVTECYGVVGMASQQIFKDGLAELLKGENFSKGVIVKNTEEGFNLDLYIIVSYNVKISEVVLEVQKKAKYMLEKTLQIAVNSVNVYVQGIKVVE
ncbi:Asp23/Gls24 family envelope stress response protein [Erysipelothrix inopinata]|uniref:Asp23/Gls24 family envelope stress response protein n=1 Tax=Erysipelothrix inopinata TaxID=225084 RepID=A0A7G9RXP3_9FIRM|nr:Asp23/Gls24 family envelope stress response protein [Erysipelothrix inopinata]QNN60368.1 Asp23/Gls24 family envelope stress response protein [Erysipelothrix inopinata]